MPYLVVEAQSINQSSSVVSRRPLSSQPLFSLRRGGMEAAARYSSQVRRAKRPRSSTTAAQIRDVGIEAAAASRRAKRRRTAQIGIPTRRAKTLRPHHPLLRPFPSHPHLRGSVRRARTCSSPRDLDSIKLQPLPRPDYDGDACHNWRDWSDLGDGPAGLIAERVLAYDVADYVRFRAVCRPWRQCSADPRSHSGLDRRFHPWRWTILRERLAAPDHRRCFLNTSTAECVRVDIPELRDHELLALTPEGLLLLARKLPCTTTICMLNPLTRHLTQLPPLSTLLPSECHDDMLPERDGLSLGGSDFRAWGSGIANDDSTVVLCFDLLGMLGMAKPGDDHWTLLEYDDGGMTAAPIMFEGRFYCINLSGVMVLETTGQPRLEVAANINMPFCRMADSFHLVNNCGELMLVRSHLRPGNELFRFYDTYRVDLDTGTLLPVKSLGGAGRALFLGMLCSLSVSLEVFPSGSMNADTIYLSFDMPERLLLNVETYHLADGSIEMHDSFVPQPHTIAQCLSLANTIIR